MLCTVSQDTETRGTTSNTWLRLHDCDLCCSESHGRIKAAGNDPGRSMFSLKQIDYHRVRLGRDEPTFQAWFALHPVWLLVSTFSIGQ